MRHKYKKFLKAAYINYDEDYCGNGSSTSSNGAAWFILDVHRLDDNKMLR
jgi:hypothetical protein